MSCRPIAALAACLCLVSPAPAEPPKPPAPPPDLVNYVTKPDASYAWKLVSKADGPTGTVYTLSLVSQTWQGVAWDHDLQIVLPNGCKPTSTMMLWNQGGKADITGGLLALTIADRLKAPVAFLYGVPKQPLYDGLKEDALIAETFTQYLKTGDPSWPLLFPMAKSVIRAMDAVQAFALAEWKFEVKDFVVTGASKRGWTSWLVAATGDKRVKAIAPLVIDTLNFPAQTRNQVKAFGKPSEMVADYTRRGLIPIPDTDAARKLWQMVDPYVYRESLTLPKLLIFGTNDPYWPQDALNSYWPDLKGPKWLLYVPNAGHDLRETDAAGKRQALPERAVATLVAFARSQVFGEAMPAQPGLKAAQTPDGVTLNAEGLTEARPARLWFAETPTRDFRKSRWTSAASYGPVAPPAAGHRAAFLEVPFGEGDKKFTLSTPITVVPAK